MSFAPYFLGLCAAVGLLACSGSSGTTTVIVRPQLLEVLPEDFLGTVRCSPDFDAGGSTGAPATPTDLVAKSYVATITDVTPTDDHGGILNFALPSSPPTPCSQSVSFSYLVTTHSYTAHIEAYAENARELAPFASGSPLLLDLSGSRVDARWSADCSGYPSSPALGGGGYGGAGSGAGGSGGAGSGAGGSAAGSAGNPGVVIFDAYTQTPHDCGSGLKSIE